MEEKYNLEVCPNCLEPNEEDLAVCKHCGMPLHPEPEQIEPVEPEALPAEAADDAPAAQEQDKKQEKGMFAKAMPYLGLYVLYVAITQFIEVKNNTDPAAGDPKLGYLACGIYMVAGILMVWPALRDWLNKRKKREEPEAVSEAQSAEDAGPESTEEQAEGQDAEETGE